MPDLAAPVRLAALAQVDGDAIALALALDGVDDPRPAVDARLAELVADLRLVALEDAALDLAAVGILADPDGRCLDAGAGRRGPAVLPHRLRVERRLLPARDLPQRLPQLLGRWVAPVPEAAPDVVDAARRVEDERERQVRQVLRVGQLEQVEVARHRSVLIREEREVGAEAGAQGA